MGSLIKKLMAHIL